MVYSGMGKYYAYYQLSRWVGPLLRLYLRLRARLGKEIPSRIAERYGQASVARPSGSLIWLHAASVGEWQSIRVIIMALRQHYPHWTVLVTTGTKTSAQLIAPETGGGLIHQFVPLDHPRWVDDFLQHWRPQLAVMVESELWPNLLMRTAARGVPMMLINARMSGNSFSSWQKSPGFIRGLLQNFSLILAQDDAYAGHFRALGAPNVVVAGNLKYAALPLPYDPAALHQWQQVTATRQAWLAASTHAPEETAIGQAHIALSGQWPNLLTVVVPRHPERSDSMRRDLENLNLRVAQRSKNDPLLPETQVYLADTMGELGLWFALCPLVFMGNSLSAKGGGHNVLEPARFGRVILHGPKMQNFVAMRQEFLQQKASIEVLDQTALIATLRDYWQKPTAFAAYGQRALAVVNANDHVLNITWQALQSYMGSSIDAAEPKYANA